MNLPRLGVKNPIAVNLLMWAIIVAGIYTWFDLVREMFPNSDPEQVIVTVLYPGATPAEVEKAVTLRLERELEDLDGVEQTQAEVLESVTALRLTLEDGADRDRVLADIRTEIDQVRPDLPDGAEEPEIVELRPFIPVMTIVVHGDVSEERLRDAVQKVEDDLLALPQISEIRISGVRDREIHAEIQPERLEEYGLTFEDVGRALGSSNLDLPGGQLETARGNVRVRTLGERERAADLEQIVIQSAPDGTVTRLGEIARVNETFEDKIERGRFAGHSAVTLSVFKTPEQDALAIADSIRRYLEKNPEQLGGAVKVEVLVDVSRFIRQRLDLMTRNARAGLILVAIALALFLDLRVAFWVAIGLPIAFLGTFVVMDWFGVSINLLSLFGLIVVLGLIVDDAIVIGEHIFTKLREGLPPAEAAIEGASQVSMPVVAAVFTTIIAFAPLAFIDGRIGQFMRELPLVVTAALLVSLVEALIILPAHLGHSRGGDPGEGRIGRLMTRVAAFRHELIEVKLARQYERLLRFVLHWRYASLAASFTISALVAGLVGAGIVQFVFIQHNDAETILINLETAAGTSEESTADVVEELEQMAAGYPETDSVFSVVGTSFSQRGRETAADPATVGQVTVQLISSEERDAAGLRTSEDIVADMRRRLTTFTGVRSLTVNPQAGGPGGRDIEIRVRGAEFDQVRGAVAAVRDELATFEGVDQIEDDLRTGKLEARIRLRDGARALGLTTRDVALQLRHALFGFEAQDLQEQQEEVTVRAVLPPDARRDLADLARLRIDTPTGARVPLEEVAEVVTERGYASLARVDGQRAVTITAEVDQARANTRDVTSEMQAKFAGIGRRFPGVSLSFEGARKDAMESVGSLAFGFPVALLAIYALLAVLFGSYLQPLLVMAAIPYALVGAVLGHWITGYPFTFLSMIGSVALAGIVVNDSLILVDFINRERRAGAPTLEAVVRGGRSRLRAILLTSITTIAGLAPLMLETSFQAQFLIPMAVAIVYGLAFATGITLLLLPTIYLVGEDLRAGAGWLVTGTWKRRLPELPDVPAAT